MLTNQREREITMTTKLDDAQAWYTRELSFLFEEDKNDWADEVAARAHKLLDAWPVDKTHGIDEAGRYERAAAYIAYRRNTAQVMNPEIRIHANTLRALTKAALDLVSEKTGGAGADESDVDSASRVTFEVYALFAQQAPGWYESEDDVEMEQMLSALAAEPDACPEGCPRCAEGAPALKAAE